VAFLAFIVIGFQPAGAQHYEISGQINIPSIDLTSDVTTLELVDYRLDTPDTIVGSYSKYSSKIFLVGHSSTVFKNLKNVSLNEYIYYDDKAFKVTRIETLEKANINMNLLLMPSKETTLVIMTCAGQPLGAKDATHRLIVTATKV
jgi:sortase (surface protein transpeptidase)